ncbi:MAG: 30S ribosomal protein S6 [Alphaproteobacteria bacterium]
MAYYEHVFIARQDVSASQVEALTDEFKTIIADNGGTVGKTEYWGLKTLQYKIKKNRKGHYVLMNVDAPSAALNELDRQQKINSDIIRTLTLRVEELDEEQSVQMQREQRRGDRGDRRGGDRDRGPRRDSAPRKDDA